MNIDTTLEKVFHFSPFRVGQREVIEAAVAGQDVLGVLERKKRFKLSTSTLARLHSTTRFLSISSGTIFYQTN